MSLAASSCLEQLGYLIPTINSANTITIATIARAKQSHTHRMEFLLRLLTRGF